jgi:hypothetical protein
MPPKLFIQLSEHDPRLYPSPTLFSIQLQNPIQARHIQNDPRPDRRASQIRPGSTRRQWNTSRDGVTHRRRNVFLGLDKHNRLGLYPIDAGIHRIGSARGVIVFDFMRANRGAKI